MNTLHHIAKLLRRHNAQLLVEHRNEAHEIVLSIPARIDDDGTIAQYAMEFRLGQQFPESAPRQTAPPATAADPNS
ncbi:MAG: hypothetical protein MUC53_13390 [Candidatus Contendobacter sp.]|nr:hypothetical protein [Candidatus Contendobacter sp.]